MKVAVMQCSKPTYWYAKEVGHEFEVTESESGTFLKIIGDPPRYLLKADCAQVIKHGDRFNDSDGNEWVVESKAGNNDGSVNDFFRRIVDDVMAILKPAGRPDRNGWLKFEEIKPEYGDLIWDDNYQFPYVYDSDYEGTFIKWHPCTKPPM